MKDDIAIGTMIGTVTEIVAEKGKGIEMGGVKGIRIGAAIMTGITADIMTEVAITADGQPVLLHRLKKVTLHAKSHHSPSRATMFFTSTRRRTP